MGLPVKAPMSWSWLGCSQNAPDGRYMRPGLQSGNPGTSRDGDTERHICIILNPVADRSFMSLIL